MINQALATAMHAMQTTIAMMLDGTPGALAFSRDTFLNIPLIADWKAITSRRKHHVNDNLHCANKKQRQYECASGQKVLKKVHSPTKLGVRTSGPYIIECVYVNGTLSIELHPGVVDNTFPLVPSEG
eukprot:9782080-Ditylum_brightwellii.AAC.1